MFEIFIAFKNTVDGVYTRDSAIAERLFYELVDEGYKVFMSKISLTISNIGEFEKHIDAALQTTSILILVGTQLDYINSYWVNYEWSEFLKEIKSGNKKGHIFSLLEGLTHEQLPEPLKGYQSFNYNELTKLIDVVKQTLPK